MTTLLPLPLQYEGIFKLTSSFAPKDGHVDRQRTHSCDRSLDPHQWCLDPGIFEHKSLLGEENYTAALVFRENTYV